MLRLSHTFASLAGASSLSSARFASGADVRVHVLMASVVHSMPIAIKAKLP